MMRVFLLCSFLLVTVMASCQQSCRSISLPVVPTVTGRGVLGLDSSSFKVTSKKQELKVSSFQIDDSPRHILIVLTNDPRMTMDDRRLALAAATNLAAKARQQNVLGLVSELTEDRAVSFSAPREQTAATLDEIAKDSKAKGARKGPLDALMAGLPWFRDGSTG